MSRLLDYVDSLSWEQVEWILAIIVAIELLAIGSLVSCAGHPPLTEPDFVEISSTRAHDAGNDAHQDAAYDAEIPWYGPDPAGNQPPKHLR